MKFEEAWQALRQGKKIARKSWKIHNFISLENEIAYEYVYEFKEKIGMIHIQNLLAEDWEIIE